MFLLKNSGYRKR